MNAWRSMNSPDRDKQHPVIYMPVEAPHSETTVFDSGITGIGAVVRQARCANRLTQSQLAEMAGTGLRFISELERGKPSVALNKTLAVLSVLGMKLQAVPCRDHPLDITTLVTTSDKTTPRNLK